MFSTLAVEAPDFRLPIELMRTLVVLLREFAKVGGRHWLVQWINE